MRWIYSCSIQQKILYKILGSCDNLKVKLHKMWASTKNTDNIYRCEFIKELCDIQDHVKLCELSSLEISQILNHVRTYWLLCKVNILYHMEVWMFYLSNIVTQCLMLCGLRINSIYLCMIKKVPLAVIFYATSRQVPRGNFSTRLLLSCRKKQQVLFFL